MLDNTLIKFKLIEESKFYGRFEIEPLDRGYGQTLGNSLRRVLLSSLKGAAVTSLKIEGIKHEYSTIPGIEEDVINIVLNLKGLKLKLYSDEPKVLEIKIKNKKGPITAGDIKGNSDLEILDDTTLIANVSDSKLDMSMYITVENGTGYSLQDEKRVELSAIPVDANFSPVERVNFTVSSARLGQTTDFDKLIIEIYTKSILPSEALINSIDAFEGILSSIKLQINS